MLSEVAESFAIDSAEKEVLIQYWSRAKLVLCNLRVFIYSVTHLFFSRLFQPNKLVHLGATNIGDLRFELIPCCSCASKDQKNEYPGEGLPLGPWRKLH